MITLIGNEVKKLLLRKKTLVILIAFILLTILIGYGTYSSSQNTKKYRSPEYRIKNNAQTIQFLKNEKSSSNVSEDRKKSLDEDIARMEKENSDLKLSGTTTIDWKKELITQNESITKDLENTAITTNGRKEEGKLQLIQNKYLIDNNIKPMDGSDPYAFEFLKTLFQALGMLFLAAGVVVFSADMVSGEYTPPTMKILLTQPISRAKVLFSKYVALVCTSIILILFVEVLGFIAMGLIFGFGNPNYPMLTGSKFTVDMSQVVESGHPLKLVAGSTYIIGIGLYSIRMFLLQILFITACSSFAFLLSTVMKSSMISISSSIVSVIALYIFQNLPFFKKVNAYIFTTYGDTYTLLTGNLAMKYNVTFISTSFAIIILILWSIICYAISNLVFTRRDVLI